MKADVPVQLVARVAGQLGSASPRRSDPGDLIPAVAAWLQDPTGVKWGSTLSGAAVDLLLSHWMATDLESLDAGRGTLREQGAGNET